MKQLTYQEINLPKAKASGAVTLEVSIANMAATLRRWRQLRAQRRRLAGLSIRLLDDIGITDERRLQEIDKPFWRT